MFSSTDEGSGSGTQLVGVTIDVHDGDSPRDVSYCAEWLARQGIRATFFVPSALLLSGDYAAALRELPAGGHELASHSHNHDGAEVNALLGGDRASLAFLRVSRDLHEDTFGASPRAFRSPAWCPLSPLAVETLAELGYAVDSSATPQRLSVLSSIPYRNTWTAAPRRPHYVHPGLLEIPTSTFLVPAGTPTFLILRRALSLAFIRLLLAEGRICGDRVLVLQLHPDDLNPRSPHRTPLRPLRAVDFTLRARGGFGFKHHLKDRDRGRISRTAREVVELVAPCRCATLAEIASAVRAWGEMKVSRRVAPPHIPGS